MKELAGAVDFTYKLDRDLARDYLAQSGYSKAQELVIGISDQMHPACSKVGQTVQNNLQAIGVSAKLQQMDQGTFMAKWMQGQMEAFIMPYGYPSTTIDDMLFQFTTLGDFMGMNNPKMKSEELDNLVLQARSTTDRAERNKYITEAMRVYKDFYVFLPLYVANVNVVYRSFLDNVQATPTYKYRAYNWSFK
jgi:ABC-type transport system substrate-binding protein